MRFGLNWFLGWDFVQHFRQFDGETLGNAINIFVADGYGYVWHDFPYMKTTNEIHNFPDELRLVPAELLRREWHLSQTTEWRMEKNGDLKPLRIGRRKFYRLADLRRFLDEAGKRPPIDVPWRKSG